MKTVFRRAVVPAELRSLLTFDRKVFAEADRFSREDWEYFESYWMIVDDIRLGCCAFEKHVDFREDVSEHGTNPRRPGSLYISTTGILPRFQGMGFGNMLKSWEVSYARYHRFTRIVTNTRKRNVAMIRLNQKFGFRVIRTTPGYYTEPSDATVVMELRLR